MMSGADETVVDVLTQYGERLGVAFQLADDVLDIASDSHESGKTPGTDLREGIPTLPVLRLRERAARLGLAEDIALCELLDSDLTDDARHAEALARLRAHPALEQARRDTVRYAEERAGRAGPAAGVRREGVPDRALRPGGAPGGLIRPALRTPRPCDSCHMAVFFCVPPALPPRPPTGRGRRRPVVSSHSSTWS